ncbi:MAG TPA: hypothetical protein VEU08_00020, partial [Vicinamibacterales bacterium]|nr:hypothetical protein [Vicinamibacterales bacterium]
MILTTLRPLFIAAAIAAAPAADLAAQTRPAPARAQPAGVQAAEPVAPALDENARDTRERLRQILDQYPPTLASVLRLDPTLMTRVDYLAPYPTLANFLAAHPEVAHNPSFFVGQSTDRYTPELSSRTATLREIQEAMVGLLVFCGLMGVLGSIVYLLRGFIDHKRWVAATKIQTEAHNKLFDRLTSNEDLMAYLQSPAGQRYLQFAPVMPDAAPRSVGAPINRIMWSAQTGIVVALGGLGLAMTRN